mmetsp:Transcript_22133/g.18960  ORF Transcript_22133/g.18960 Transcript_22133/m.18960 type:complete len:94 (+) Transcript_22133:79-360(+)
MEHLTTLSSSPFLLAKEYSNEGSLLSYSTACSKDQDTTSLFEDDKFDEKMTQDKPRKLKRKLRLQQSFQEYHDFEVENCDQQNNQTSQLSKSN